MRTNVCYTYWRPVSRFHGNRTLDWSNDLNLPKICNNFYFNLQSCLRFINRLYLYPLRAIYYLSFFSVKSAEGRIFGIAYLLLLSVFLMDLYWTYVSQWPPCHLLLTLKPKFQNSKSYFKKITNFRKYFFKYLSKFLWRLFVYDRQLYDPVSDEIQNKSASTNARAKDAREMRSPANNSPDIDYKKIHWSSVTMNHRCMWLWKSQIVTQLSTSV